MAAVRKLTDKPFGLDLLTALPGQVDSGIDAVIEGGARIFVAGLGVPREVVDRLHANNVFVGSMCGKVRHAVSAVASGCDFVVAQGTEAGGHTGTVATMALVPQVVDGTVGRRPFSGTWHGCCHAMPVDQRPLARCPRRDPGDGGGLWR